MKKIFTIGFALFFSLSLGVTSSFAQQTSERTDQNNPIQPNDPINQPAIEEDITRGAAGKTDFFKAVITDIKNEKEENSLDGIKTYVQTITVKGIDAKWQNKTVIIENSEFNTIGPKALNKGDNLLIAHTQDENGQNLYSIVDYVREPGLFILIALFVVMVIVLGKGKGLKALFALGLSFFIIIGFLVPQILHGGDPVFISTIAALLITLSSLYITHGFKPYTHIGSVSILLSLIVTVILSIIFTEITKLSGTSDEQVVYLQQLLGGTLNLKGLLLAGFIIGALGILDDVVVNQVSVIEELHHANHQLSWRELFKKGLKVGIDHISAIVNTLFLAYVGSSLPLIMLFAADQLNKFEFPSVLNLEIITTEIVRTLVGSLGLIAAVPITTLIAAILVPKIAKQIEGKEHIKQFHSHSH